MSHLNERERTILLTKLGVKNAIGLREAQRKYLRLKPNGKLTADTFTHARKALGVRCITTDETFPSINAAARAHNLSAGNLCDHLRGKHHTIGGKQYEYVREITNQ